MANIFSCSYSQKLVSLLPIFTEQMYLGVAAFMSSCTYAHYWLWEFSHFMNIHRPCICFQLFCFSVKAFFSKRKVLG